jgi:hypothetical protein
MQAVEEPAMNATSILQSTRDLIPLARRAPRAPRLPHATAQGLAVFSVILGAIELIAPQRLAAMLGLGGKENWLRAYGGREIAAGAAALAGFVGPAMWARVFGDLVDLATLALGRRTSRTTARNITIALGAVAGIALLDICVAGFLSSRARR